MADKQDAASESQPKDTKSITKASAWLQLMIYVQEELREAQRLGYVVPENNDFEVSMWMEMVSYGIAGKAYDLVQPDEYIYVDGLFYAKKAVIDLVEPGRRANTDAANPPSKAQ